MLARLRAIEVPASHRSGMGEAADLRPLPIEAVRQTPASVSLFHILNRQPTVTVEKASKPIRDNSNGKPYLLVYGKALTLVRTARHPSSRPPSS